MKIIVTGGAGFIGSHLVERLLSFGHEIVILDNFSTGRPQNLIGFGEFTQVIECDLSVDGDWVDHIEGANWVFHLAALADIVPSIRKPVDYFASNVTGTLNLLNACKKNKVSKFVYSASSSCYGIPEIYPTPETAKISPKYPYALTKRLGEELVLHWEQVYGLPAVSLRFFNVYGRRSRTSGTYGAVLGVFLAQKLAGEPLTIVGDGEQTRDFTHVSDVVDALITAAEVGRSGEVYNVGSGKTVSINELASLIGGSTIHIPRRPGEPDCTFADISKIEKYLGWKPVVSMEDGVNDVLRHISDWSKAPVWTPEAIAVETDVWFKLLGQKEKEK